MSIWDTLAEFTQKCDVSACLLQNTSKSDRYKSPELGKQEKSSLKNIQRRLFRGSRAIVSAFLDYSQLCSGKAMLSGFPNSLKHRHSKEREERRRPTVRKSKMSSALHAKSSIHTIAQLQNSIQQIMRSTQVGRFKTLRWWHSNLIWENHQNKITTFTS